MTMAMDPRVQKAEAGAFQRHGLTIPLLLCFALVAVVVICAIFGSSIAPDSPFTQRLDVGDKPPSAQFLAGTDLLGRDADGDRTILKVCEAGLLPNLLNPAVWGRKAEDFQNVWSHVPEKYKDGLDADAFLNEIRQARLQSYAKPKFGGFKPK